MPDPFVEELEQRARKAFKELNLEYTPSARVYLQKQSSLEFVRVSHETLLLTFILETSLEIHSHKQTLSITMTMEHSCFRPMYEGSKSCPVCGEDWSYDYMTLTKEQCVDAGKHMKSVDNEKTYEIC